MNKTLLISFLILIISVTIYGQTNSFKENSNLSVVEVYKTKPDSKAFSERIITTSIVISELALLLGILYYWKKTRNEGKSTNKNIFKKNIKALREEKIKYFENEKLSSKRKLLYLKINKKIIDGRFITSKAKRLSISKGEIFLAARIKQLQTKT